MLLEPPKAGTAVGLFPAAVLPLSVATLPPAAPIEVKPLPISPPIAAKPPVLPPTPPPIAVKPTPIPPYRPPSHPPRERRGGWNSGRGSQAPVAPSPSSAPKIGQFNLEKPNRETLKNDVNYINWAKIRIGRILIQAQAEETTKLTGLAEEVIEHWKGLVVGALTHYMSRFLECRDENPLSVATIKKTLEAMRLSQDTWPLFLKNL
jgi:hypothetical protein